MEKITFIEIDTISGPQIHAIIDNGDGSFTSMWKSTYDEQQANKDNLLGGNI